MSQEPEYLALVYVERNAVDGIELFEALGEGVGLDGDHKPAKQYLIMLCII
jgi:hypothetical protein